MVRGSEVVLSFDHTDGGLIAKDGELKGFVIAGEVLNVNPSIASPETAGTVLWSWRSSRRPAWSRRSSPRGDPPSASRCHLRWPLLASTPASLTMLDPSNARTLCRKSA